MANIRIYELCLKSIIIKTVTEHMNSRIFMLIFKAFLKI